MPIMPLPQFEADVEADRKVYQALKAPKSIVVRFGLMKMVGEFPYDGEAKPGCGSKIVVRTQRGTEIGEMLTSTCPNSGCSKSVTRKEMLEYIENSGGRDYPFHSDGRVLRVATAEDMQAQEKLEQLRNAMRLEARRIADELKLPVKIVEAEPILGGERITFFFMSDDRIDFRDLIRPLSQQFNTRVEMRQVGARDEARLTADYERCGQYCCCKNFLKVLKPISMRSAKIQKATLDPLKISGRCGRLMCCLRYEDQTYDELRKRLPRRKQRVGTPEGDGWVVDTQILTQLALVQLENENKQVAIAVEDLSEPGPVRAPASPAQAGASRSAAPPPARAGKPSDRPSGQSSGRGTESQPSGEPTGDATPARPAARGPRTGPPSTKQGRRRGRNPDQGADTAQPAEDRVQPEVGDGPQQMPGSPATSMPPADAGPDSGADGGSTGPEGDKQGSDSPASGAGASSRRRRRRRRGRGGDKGKQGGEGGGGGDSAGGGGKE